MSGGVRVELTQDMAAAGLLAGGEADGAADGVVGVPGGPEVDGQGGDEQAGEQDQSSEAGAGGHEGAEGRDEIVHVPPPVPAVCLLRGYDIGRRCPDYMSRFRHG